MHFERTRNYSLVFFRSNQFIPEQVSQLSRDSLPVFAVLTKLANLILIICLCFSLAFGAGSGKHHRKTRKRVVVKIVRLSDEVFMLSTSGAEIGVGNIGVSAGRDGILLVDTQLASLVSKIKAALKKIGAGKVRFVVNTHWHADHTGGNSIFGRKATIIAQQNVLSRLSDENLILMPKKGLPVINYDHSLSLNFNDDEIKIIHFPNAHTDGDSIVFFTRAIIVHLGDLYKGHRFPGVDTGQGGSVTGLIAAVGQIIQMLPENVKIIPGHGQIADLKDLRDYLKMLTGTVSFVEKQISLGKSLEQIKKEGLPVEFDSWDNGLTTGDLWIGQIYESLSDKKLPVKPLP